MSPQKKSTWRKISVRDRVLLWGRAAARCNHPDCKLFLVEPASSEDNEAMFGQAAHIVAHSECGPRGDETYPTEDLDTYGNLILLCGNHHSLVDKQPNTYTSDDLRGWKSEHESWVHSATEPEGYTPIPWIVIVQEDHPQIDVPHAIEALSPDVANGEPFILCHSPYDLGWQTAVDLQSQALRGLLDSIAPTDRRLAVFSLTRIPLAVHLGYVLSDRYRVSLYQFHRDSSSWRWPGADGGTGIRTEYVWNEDDARQKGGAVIRVSLSAEVKRTLTQDLVSDPLVDVHITTDDPSLMWLRSRTQLDELSAHYREAVAFIRNRLGKACTGVHLFYAGPTGGAIAIGRQHNPWMNPPLHLYDYDIGKSPPYDHVLVLGQD